MLYAWMGDRQMSLNWTESLVEVTLSPAAPRYGAFCPGMWVKLHERPHPLSHDEALLLCADAEEFWSVWIPDYGETKLSADQFYRLSS
jgi:hypothetical protein